MYEINKHPGNFSLISFLLSEIEIDATESTLKLRDIDPVLEACVIDIDRCNVSILECTERPWGITR